MTLVAPRSPESFPHSPLARALRQPLMLGLFLPIQSGRLDGVPPAAHDDLDLRLQRRADPQGRGAGLRSGLRLGAMAAQGRL
ncbi:MAG: hypothetical protein WDN69_17105 [Aliidongia sp.]